MKKVTYLLGAGASAEAIPVLNKMKSSVEETLAFLESFQLSQFNEEAIKLLPEMLRKKENQQLLGQLIEDFKWLIEEVGDYYTIDTLAKKYFLSNSWTKELIRLKKCLIVYFTVIQFIQNSKIDKRYASFIATIADRTDDDYFILNENIKIISWNYDLQFELALQKFYSRQIHHLKEIYHIYPNQASFNATDRPLTERDKFGFVKLNGNAIWDKVGQKRLTIYDWDDAEDNSTYNKDGIQSLNMNERMGYFLNEYFFATSSQFTTDLNFFIRFLNFAWETRKNFINNNYTGFSNNHNEAKKIAEDTEILVVIGYSFPVFNRVIDNKLFELMKKLEKIYIQDLFPGNIKTTMVSAFRNVEEKYKNNKDIFLEDNNLNQFIVPYEIASSF